MPVPHSEKPWQTVEADFGFGSVKIKFKEMNLYEEDLVQRANAISLHQFIVENLFLRARNETGVRIWTKPEERQAIEREFNPKEVKRVVNVMCAAGGEPGN